MADDPTDDLFPMEQGTPPRAGGKSRRRTPPPPFALYARVAVNQPVTETFDYGVTEEMRPDVEVGAIVEVPFGRQVARGCVLELHPHPPAGVPPDRIRPVQRRLSPGFRIEAPLIHLAGWMSEYYLASPGEALACVSFIGFNDLRDKSVRMLRLSPAWEEAARTRRTATGRPAPLTPQQVRVIDALLSAGDAGLEPPLLRDASGAGDAVLNRLVADGLIEEARRTEHRHDEYGTPATRDTPLVMNAAQELVFGRIADAMDARRPDTFLIHGVTGSGKTEVYLRAIARALDEGGTAIVLVPEISLTPQTVDRFRSRFGAMVGVYHSRLTAGQKFDLWRQVHAGTCRIMVGARSALFTPFADLRVIVIDEEHETSYKQDSTPRYNARDMAIVRARQERCVVILGSATPSVETYHKALNGRFELLNLAERVDHRGMPPVRVVNMTKEVREGRNPGLFSEALHTAMTQALGRGEQVLLFLNRRGYFNFVVCLACSTPVTCAHCDVTLTHHKPRNILQCHYCAREYVMPRKCAACEATELSMVGLGTQRVEETVQEEFPGARVIRMDLDTTRQRNAYLDAWRRIERGEVDVILGTQMIAKGIHLERVTLVGVPLADVSLFQPDFRSAERAFSLLTQVAGRAGRGERPGQVIIQTFVPHHYAIRYAETHDYRGFFEKEITVRRVLRFPPHFRLVSILGSGRSQARTAELFKEFARHARNACFATGGAVTALGPVPAPIPRINDEYRWRLLLRGTDHRDLKRVVARALERFADTPGKSTIQLTIDVDPQDLM